MRQPIAIVTAALGLVISLACVGCGSSTPQSYFPTPGPGRTLYRNAKYGYLLTYPTQWHLSVFESGDLVRIFPATSVMIPDALAIDVQCAPNPHHLSPQAWWQNTQNIRRTESALGAVKLASGVNAYAATGHGQTTYIVYTITSVNVACQVTMYDLDKPDDRFVSAAANTFSWLSA